MNVTVAFQLPNRLAMEWSQRIGRRISLRDLHILFAAVQCKSLARAADHLAVSRPVVSKAIADLERTLGVRLLERNRHGAEPTIYGAALLKRGTVIFDELRASIGDIEFLNDPAAGEVRVGCHHFLASGFVSAVAERLTRKHLRTKFHIVAGETAAIYQNLHDRNVDVLVAWRLGSLADEALTFEPLYDDRCVVAASERHPLARRRYLKLKELMRERWALPPAESILGIIEAKAFRDCSLDYPHASVLSVNPQVLINQLATGRFITIVPASVLQLPVKNPQVKILPVELPADRLSIGLVTLKNRTLSPATKLFIDTARQVALGLKVKAVDRRTAQAGGAQ